MSPPSSEGANRERLQALAVTKLGGFIRSLPESKQELLVQFLEALSAQEFSWMKDLIGRSIASGTQGYAKK